MLNGRNGLREFGRLRLDVENKFLWHDGLPVDLPLKGLELLCLLARNEGSVVSKPEIWDSVWRDSFVEETNLTHHIYLLRRKFKELGEPDPIETVPRRGYRFRTRDRDEGLVIERHAFSETVIEEIPSVESGRKFPPRVLLLSLAACFAIAAVSVGGYLLLENGRSVAARSLYSVESGPVASAHTVNADAWIEYTKGRIEWNKRNHAGMLEAQRLFRNAVSLDPNFALAYVGLADTLATGPDVDGASRSLERALELNPNLAEAHASHGFISMFHNRNWKVAETSLKKATELDPNYATAHQWLAVLHSIQGRNDEAKAAMLRALDLNPASPNFLADMGQVHYFARDYRAAEAFCRKALEIDPDFAFAHEYLHDIYLMTGEYDKAVDAELEALRIIASFPNDSRRLLSKLAAERARQRQVYAKYGVEGFERDRLTNSSGYIAATRLAFIGDNDGAIANLERAVEAGEFLAVFAKSDPAFDRLRNEPRYRTAVSKMRLD